MQDKLKNVREHLIKVAQSRETITYSKLAKACGLSLNLREEDDRSKLINLLDGIGRQEHEAGRPLLNALVVMAKSGLPSVGFYRLAATLKHGEVKELRREFFAVKQILKCFQEWGSQTSKDTACPCCGL